MPTPSRARARGTRRGRARARCSTASISRCEATRSAPSAPCGRPAITRSRDAGDGLLPLRQRRDRRTLRAAPPSSRPRAHRRLGRAPRERHASARRERSRDSLRLDAPVAVVSRHGPRGRSRPARDHSGTSRWPAGSRPSSTCRRCTRAIDDATRAFTPDIVLISAGFDSLRDDPLGGFTLEIEHIERLTRMLVERASTLVQRPRRQRARGRLRP